MEPKILPQIVLNYVESVIRKMKYRRKVRQDVKAELLSHFEDALRNISDETDKQKKAEALIRDFGDAKVLAVLIRRGKKRCRPLWHKAIIRSFQAVGAIFLLLVFYIGWFFSGKPIITTNYLEVMNKQVKPVADESQNAWPLYKQAAERYVKYEDKKFFDFSPRRLSSLSEEDRRIILQAIRNNQGSLDLIRQGNQKPYYWQIYGTEGNRGQEMLAMLMPHLASYRDLSRLLCWQAILDAERGDIQNAFDNTLGSYSFGKHLRGQNTTLIEQLVAIAIEAKSTEVIRMLLGENSQNIDAPLLDSIRKQFKDMISKENFTLSFEAERLCLRDTIQRNFTQSRLGKSHLYIQNVGHIALFGYEMSSMGFNMGIKQWFHLLFTHPDGEQTPKAGEQFYDTMSELAAKTPALLRKEGIDIDKRIEEITENNLWLKILAPAIGKISQKSYHNRTASIATLTIFAIFQYQKAHHSYPDSLETLVQSELILELPMDPYSDKPLVYRKTTDGFMLYGVGSNLTDDGGIPSTNNKGQKFQFGEHGDWVFWPVQKEPAKVLPSTTPGKN